MKLFKLILVAVFFMMTSCDKNVRESETGESGKQPDFLEKTDKVVSQQKLVEVDYRLFNAIIDSISDDVMRLDAKRGMSVLHLKFNSSGVIPLSSIAVLFDSLIDRYPLQKHDQLLLKLSEKYAINNADLSALSALNKLISRYPEISYYDKVQYRRANILFNNNQFYLAEKAYIQVVEYRKESDRSIYY